MSVSETDTTNKPSDARPPAPLDAPATPATEYAFLTDPERWPEQAAAIWPTLPDIADETDDDLLARWPHLCMAAPTTKPYPRDVAERIRATLRANPDLFGELLDRSDSTDPRAVDAEIVRLLRGLESQPGAADALNRILWRARQQRRS